MKSSASTVRGYLDALPAERRSALEQVRNVVLEHLPKGYEEAIGYGMICYQVPRSAYPKTYNGQPLLYAALASQKNHMAVYLMCVYASPQAARELKDGFERAGKKLDMGKSCIRFKRLEDLALGAIGKAVGGYSMRDFIAIDQAVHGKQPKSKPKSTRRTRTTRPSRARSAR